MKLKQHENGRYYAHVWTEAGTRPVSLRTTNKDDAKILAREAKLAQLEQAARVRALTQETFSRIIAGRKVTGQTAFDVWKEWARVVGLGRNTIERYSTYITMFLENSGFDRKPLCGVDDLLIDQFVNPVGSDIVLATRRNRLASLSSYFQVAMTKGLIPCNPVAGCVVKIEGLSFDQKEPDIREPFTDEELRKLRTLTDPFAKAVVLLGEHYGLRIGDVAQLEKAAVNFAHNQIVIWTDKRDVRLEMPLFPLVRDHLQSPVVTESSPVTSPYYFPTQREDIFDVKRRAKLSVYFGRALRRLGIEGKSAHCLRHTFATKQAHLGRTVDEIRAKLGHSSVETTRGYLHEVKYA